MTEKQLFYLLRLIKNNGNIKRLLYEGFSFRTIAEATNISIREGYLAYNDKELTLTANGQTKLSELEPLMKKVNKEQWIQKEIKSKIPKLEEDFIFLPNQNELHF